MGVVAEGKGEAVGTVAGVGLVDGFNGVSIVSSSPNVPSAPTRETKQEAGGSVPVTVVYVYVGNVYAYVYVGLYDTPTEGGFVVAKTVRAISSVFCQYFYETCKKVLLGFVYYNLRKSKSL